MTKIYGKTAGKILLGFAVWFAAAMMLILALNPVLEDASYFATQFGFIIAALVMYQWLDKKNGWSLGWKDAKREKHFLTGAGIAVLIPVLSVLLMISFASVSFEPNPWNLSVLMGQLLLFLAVAVGEETFFRGYVFGVVKHAFHTKAAILLSTLLFAGVHVINPGAFTRPAGVITIEIANIFLIGLVFAFARVYSGSLWMPIGLHFIMNAVQSSVFGFLNGGKKVESFWNPLFPDQTIWNGAGYGLESSLMLTPVLLLTLIAMIWWHGNRMNKNEKMPYNQSAS